LEYVLQSTSARQEKSEKPPDECTESVTQEKFWLECWSTGLS
jgi:hypothetical protein